MTVPQNANEIALHLAKLARQLDEITQKLNEADERAVILREDATLAESRAFVEATGAEQLRKHKARIASHDERLAADAAEAIVRGLNRSSWTLRARIEIGRSIGATVRTEVGLSGSGIHGS